MRRKVSDFPLRSVSDNDSEVRNRLRSFQNIRFPNPSKVCFLSKFHPKNREEFYRELFESCFFPRPKVRENRRFRPDLSRSLNFSRLIVLISDMNRKDFLLLSL